MFSHGVAHLYYEENCLLAGRISLTAQPTVFQSCRLVVYESENVLRDL